MPVQPPEVHEEPATTVPPPVRIHITRSPEGEVLIHSSHRIPAKELVLQQLDASQRTLIPPRHRRYSQYSLRVCIDDTTDTIPLQQWSDAIGAATIKALACTAAASETEMVHIANGGLLAIGDSIYKLSAVQHMPTSRALAIASRAIRSKARDQANTIIEAANQHAARIKSDAEAVAHTVTRNAIRMREEAEQLMRNANLEFRVPPAWTMDNSVAIKAVQFANGHICWHVGMWLFITPSVFIYEYAWNTGTRTRRARREWLALPCEPVTTYIWIPLQDNKGTYAPTSIYVDNAGMELPHISHNRGCMEIPDSPRLLDSYDSYKTLRAKLLRVMSGVTLNSLLTTPSAWRKAFREAMPEDLRMVLFSSDPNTNLQRMVLDAVGQPLPGIEVTTATENEETWTARGATQDALEQI